MNKTRILISLGVIATLVLAMTPATAALANAPIKFSNPVNSTPYKIDPNGCAFDIWEQRLGTEDLTFFLDQNGDVIGAFFNAGYTVTWTANGKTASLEVKGPFHIKTWRDGKEIDMSIGTNHVLVLPGYGPVYGYAGQISVTYNWMTGQVIDEKAVGNIVDPPNWAAICAYFAP